MTTTDPWDTTPFPLSPRRYVVMTDGGEIEFASLEQAMAYRHARDACYRVDRRIKIIAFAAIVLAIGIAAWRYWG